MCCPKKIQQMFLFQFKPKDEKVSFGVNFLNIMIVRCNDDAMIPPPILEKEVSARFLTKLVFEFFALSNLFHEVSFGV